MALDIYDRHLDRTHNNPPEPIRDLNWTPEEWVAHLTQAFAVPQSRKAELLGAAARFEAGHEIKKAATPGSPPLGIEKWDDEVAGKAGDLRDKIQATIKQANDLHSLEKAPVLAAGRAIDGYRNNFISDLSAAVDLIKGRLTVYLTHKADVARRRAQAEADAREAEAKRIAEQAAQAMASNADDAPETLDRAAEAFGQAAEAREQATAPAATLSRTYGALGSVSSLRTTWQFVPEKSDLMALAKAVVAGKAPLDFLAFNTTRIGYAIRSEKLRACEGLAIEEIRKAS